MQKKSRPKTPLTNLDFEAFLRDYIATDKAGYMHFFVTLDRNKKVVVRLKSDKGQLFKAYVHENTILPKDAFDTLVTTLLKDPKITSRLRKKK